MAESTARHEEERGGRGTSCHRPRSAFPVIGWLSTPANQEVQTQPRSPNPIRMLKPKESPLTSTLPSSPSHESSHTPNRNTFRILKAPRVRLDSGHSKFIAWSDREQTEGVQEEELECPRVTAAKTANSSDLWSRTSRISSSLPLSLHPSLSLQPSVPYLLLFIHCPSVVSASVRPSSPLCSP
ncbi:unnamed protein product [Boreogadus saida]